MNWPSHGANPQYIYETMNILMPDEIIDLSANINPLGPPKILKENWPSFYDSIVEYPDPAANRLRETVAKKEDLDKEMIMIGNGGAELISLLGRMFAEKKVLIIQPTFSEYEKACQINGCEVIHHSLDENWQLRIEHLPIEDIDAIFLCNPNNPTGMSSPYEQMLALSELCKERDIYLIIDEAFYDFCEDYQSLIPIVGNFANVIMIRSMTKMFAIPGLRLGYLLADEKVIQKLANFQSHWSVNAVAMLAGELCLREVDFVQETRTYIKKEREKLFAFFNLEGFIVSPSKTDFYLLKDPNIKDQLPLFEFLLRRGIVPRHTMNFPGIEGQWLRFAIKSSNENNQLLEALKEWKK
ncbi:threonine-phosphate decarboxylase CobD [Robertmurraya kyonggiensis]|uniref:threonine-phosphate decarboxylase n=1 Tax=Robertmurraya kyonggiensis TaxID=1037680 RepID=A0A4U1CZG9_9BACI|nr:threonine-phosphate decarboxylase CobD [Robertmurraya kyonggiensis]TKC14848.1 threonine-phosphate decarboxylase [Robertmurraya kyonggiensis]